eukprot:CAMPEP_0206039812 /NCGR_PEP_ID=MMETSP1466-20131121/4992_1 /ASSEMBLY_ACC=CAM_ASM_001126 /TAXON_ID=44452 /ORGANISM="Pavlova gyrans, Strain CCMP608" /LENGTH=692 /DNA_ID=CAMNT_0053414467 /DNA_START=75 /DNA_END=2149 /DNA_ORIENTATION=+
MSAATANPSHREAPAIPGLKSPADLEDVKATPATSPRIKAEPASKAARATSGAEMHRAKTVHLDLDVSSNSSAGSEKKKTKGVISRLKSLRFLRSKKKMQSAGQSNEEPGGSGSVQMHRASSSRSEADGPIRSRRIAEDLIDQNSEFQATQDAERIRRGAAKVSSPSYAPRAQVAARADAGNRLPSVSKDQKGSPIRESPQMQDPASSSAAVTDPQGTDAKEPEVVSALAQASATVPIQLEEEHAAEPNSEPISPSAEAVSSTRSNVQEPEAAPDQERVPFSPAENTAGRPGTQVDAQATPPGVDTSQPLGGGAAAEQLERDAVPGDTSVSPLHVAARASDDSDGVGSWAALDRAQSLEKTTAEPCVWPDAPSSPPKAATAGIDEAGPLASSVQVQASLAPEKASEQAEPEAEQKAAPSPSPAAEAPAAAAHPVPRRLGRKPPLEERTEPADHEVAQDLADLQSRRLVSRKRDMDPLSERLNGRRLDGERIDGEAAVAAPSPFCRANFGVVDVDFAVKNLSAEVEVTSEGLPVPNVEVKFKKLAAEVEFKSQHTPTSTVQVSMGVEHLPAIKSMPPVDAETRENLSAHLVTPPTPTEMVVQRLGHIVEEKEPTAEVMEAESPKEPSAYTEAIKPEQPAAAKTEEAELPEEPSADTEQIKPEQPAATETEEAESPEEPPADTEEIKAQQPAAA